MIPETIDVLALVLELNEAGWRDFKIEMICPLPRGYLAAIKSARIVNPRYEIAARIYNFHAANVPRGTNNNQTVLVAPDIT